MTLHREGTKYILLATLLWAAIGAVCYVYIRDVPLLFWAINFVCFLFWLWIVSFFRLPNRALSTGDNIVISPADGKVVVIEETFEPEFFKDKRLQVSIFMSPLNVHINRAPIKGIVKYMKYHSGKYLVAWHPKSSTENERTTMVIENSHATLLLRQIAGAVARRIKYYVKEGQTVEQNQEFGFIRFGSRVDVFFPIGTVIDVKIGDTVKGGVTVLGKIGVLS